MESINPEIMNNGQQADVPEIVGSRDISTKVVANAIKYELQSSMMLAKQYPRNIEQSRSLILKTCKRPGFAKKVRYYKPIGAKKITGTSVRAAEMLANLWGNIKSISYVIYDEDGDDIRKIPGRRILYVMSIDLESNTSYSSQVTIDKTVERSKPRKGQIIYDKRTNSRSEITYIVKPTEDEFSVKEKKTLAIEKRNTILALIPDDIKEEMLEKSDETNQNKIKEDPDKALRTILDYFSGINILPKEIEKYLDHPINIITPAEIEDLRVIAQSIQSGASTWYDFIELAENTKRKTKSKAPKDPKTSTADKIAAKAAETTEPTPEPPTTTPVPDKKEPEPKTPPPAGEGPEFRDIQEVIDMFRSAADVRTLMSMEHLVGEVEPGFRTDARTEFDRDYAYLKTNQTSEAPASSQQKNDDLMGKLRTNCMVLDTDKKALVAGLLFNDRRKTKFYVKDLDQEHLLKLKEILISQGLYQDDE